MGQLGTKSGYSSSHAVQQVASMPKLPLSPSEKRSFSNIPADQKLALISSYSEALRKLARSTEAVGRADMLPKLIQVADGLDSMATAIAETEAGAEVMARAARLIRATEGMLASMSSSSIIH
ncbi:hypothetical protein [Rhizobium leguminosarum]|jgi:hypothetical protein|uniref:hypothetical protein n=1 Tax=Rhizobium leguminosarum TaxID=384 RepID=UPI0024B37D56|nr:hypothetical protein [Rhizobium leguminosarum]WHO80036.1 hypothetical protein QMO81_002742 [Rhizobium leguminosarum]